MCGGEEGVTRVNCRWVAGVFICVECVLCCMASPMAETKERNCESFTGLTDQPVFRAQESVYRDGKQRR